MLFRVEVLVCTSDELQNPRATLVKWLRVSYLENLTKFITLPANLLLTLSCTENQSCIHVFKLSLESHTTPSPAIFTKDIRRKVLLWDFEQDERKLSLLTADNSNADVSVYIFNENFKTLQCVKQVPFSTVFHSLKLPAKSICFFGGAVGLLLVTDLDDSSQFYTLNTGSISRKMNFKDDTMNRHPMILCKVKKGSALFVLQPMVTETSIGGAETLKDGADALEGGTKASNAISSSQMSDGSEGKISQIEISTFVTEDFRPLPKICIDLQQAVKWQNLSIFTQDDTLAIIDRETSTLMCYTFKIQIQSSCWHLKCQDTVQRSHKKIVNSHWLWSLFHAYEKFPVLGLLQAESLNCHQSTIEKIDLDLNFVCSTPGCMITKAAKKDIVLYLEIIMNWLKNLQKPMYGLDLTKDVVFHSTCCSPGVDLVSHIMSNTRTVKANEWLRDLVALAPIQICRTENNALIIMSDGKDEPLSVPQNCCATDIAPSIRFGLMTAVIQLWAGRVIVVTSMGKQSTGKSYFLNHLSGSSFAISGARCTDGAWMTYLVAGDVMIILLDFEGLGSIERSEQEDVFLSVLNSSISQLTVFRIEMRFDKDIDSMFQKFQSGVNLVSGNPLLFQGILCLNIKDVNPNDKDSVYREFHGKLQKMLVRSGGTNFLKEMYGGRCRIMCWPTLGTADYYWKMKEVCSHIKMLCNKKSGYQSGIEFLTCLRLVLAKIYLLDWTSVDKGLQKLQLAYVQNQLENAIRFGCTIQTDTVIENRNAPKEPLKTKKNERITFSLSEMKEFEPQYLDSWNSVMKEVFENIADDTDFDLGRIDTENLDNIFEVESCVLYSLYREFMRLSKSDICNTKDRIEFESLFDHFLSFIYLRRRKVVQAWVKDQVGEFGREVTELAEGLLARLKLSLTRCSKSCTRCKLGCLFPFSHSVRQAHNCGTDHICSGYCDYCSFKKIQNKCQRPAGEVGKCDCKKMNHTCGDMCSLSNAANCAHSCSKIIGHSDAHRCDAGIHTCNTACSVPNCKGNCVIDIERYHTVHKCPEVRCIESCFMPECIEICSCLDHFHGNESLSLTYISENNITQELKPWGVESGMHMCSKPHSCRVDCEIKGICEHKVVLSEKTVTFHGKRSSFSYTLQEMNGKRKMCSFVIDPFKRTHDGLHSCLHGKEESNRVHYCTGRCPCCLYFCNKPIGHDGLHATSHGNMRSVYFVSKDVDIDVSDKKYAAGDKGIAEMCPLFCSQLGRGHHHYVPCNETMKTCAYNGKSDRRRHCRLALEPHPNKPMDEILHKEYWKSLGWEDAVTSIADLDNFNMCPIECKTSNHQDENGNPERSFCLLPVWHEPVNSAAEKDSDQFQYSYGHKFGCRHVSASGKFHHIFVLDSSGSMAGRPWANLIEAVKAYIAKRLTKDKKICQDIISVVVFDCDALIVTEGHRLCLTIADKIKYKGGGTNFDVALREANAVLSRNKHSEFIPVALFFSDGQCSGGDVPAQCIGKSFISRGLQAFAIGFNINSSDRNNLIRLVTLMGGKYFDAANCIDLTEKFETISVGLEKNIGLVAEENHNNLNVMNLEQMVCSICTDELDPNASNKIELKCSHAFHMACLQDIVAYQNGNRKICCPNCRIVDNLVLPTI